jgi:hypothetical protein
MAKQIELQLIREMQKNDQFSRNNYKKLQEKYANKYVAIEDGRVIANGSSMVDLHKRATKIAKDARLVLFEFIPAKGTTILF